MSPAWLYTKTYYYERFNVIQMIRGLYDLGGNEYVARQLRFDGRVEKEVTKQQVTTGDHSLEKMYEYDHADRLLSTRYIVKSSNTEMKNIVVAASRYDGVGQLRKRFLNSTDASMFREQLDYSYVPRGWMSKVLGKTGAGDNFGIELKYTNTANAQYNGNIGEMSRKRTGSSNWGGYNFTYDKANRLTNATGTHQEHISYDRNGNIQTLNRWIDGSQKDGLTYTYDNGNQLTKVTDSQGTEGFNNGSSGSGDDYSYDSNGNATRDANRGIGENGIKYNILNLPREISLNSKTLSYHYDATGGKLRMQNNTDNTKYAGAFEYNSGNYLTRIGTEEGQILIINNGANASDYIFEYYLRDHLGNTRMVLNEAGTIVQETEYMPFGLAIPRTAGTNKYLYNGKEKQPETGYMDYGFRQYDPSIGRWMVVDPMSEDYKDYTPYNYVFSNPLLWTDPDGRCPTCPQGDEAAAMYQPGATVTNQYGSWTWTGTAWVENATIQEYKPSFGDQWREGNGLQQFGYAVIDAPYSLFHDYHWGGRAFENYDDKIGTRLMGLLSVAGPILQSGATFGSAAKEVTTVLEGAIKSNYRRFVSKIPANSKASSSIQLLDDGNYLFQATSPGKVPGSSAIYQKWVNPQGETFKTLKTTFAPDGSIIHIKSK